MQQIQAKRKVGGKHNRIFERRSRNRQPHTAASSFRLCGFHRKNHKETIPEELVGFNREEADGYFKKYMQNLPVEEFLNGLQSIGITTFSKDRIIVRKIYDPSKVKYRYYLIAVDGEVVVYYGDQKTVYEYTGISTDTLSKEEQMSLKNGIEVKDEDALYGLLENYSS